MTNKIKNSEITQQQMIIAGIVAVVVIAIGIFVALQFMNGQSSGIDYSEIPQERTEDGAFILGNPEAPVTLVAFEDFLCPHCQTYQTEVHEILEQYVATGQMRFEFRMLPISQFSANTFGLAECSAELNPGSFWNAHDEIFRAASTSRITDAGSIRELAEDSLGLNYGEVLDCLQEADQYQIDGQLASRFDEVTGTPSVGWRLNDGPIRFDGISRRPSPREVGQLLDRVNAGL